MSGPSLSGILAKWSLSISPTRVAGLSGTGDDSCFERLEWMHAGQGEAEQVHAQVVGRINSGASVSNSSLPWGTSRMFESGVGVGLGRYVGMLEY